MLVLRKLYSGYNKIFNENLDPRLENLPFTGSPIPVLIVLVSYLFFVTGRGQKWMENRKPFELTKIMNCYNILQVLANAYVFFMAITEPLKHDNFEFFCVAEPKNLRNSQGDIIVKVSYFFYFLKVVDLLDTVFFILRKKNNQVTFLHIYHHAGVFTIGYIYMKIYSGGGTATFFGFLNSFIHTVMYFYYFLTSYSPEVKKSLWWKKYITQLQLLQFVLMLIYVSISMFVIDCNNSKIMSWAALTQAVVMLAMFSDFYYKAYIKKKN